MSNDIQISSNYWIWSTHFFTKQIIQLTWSTIDSVPHLHSVAFESVATRQSNQTRKKIKRPTVLNIQSDNNKREQTANICIAIEFTWFHGTNTVRVIGWNGERWNCNVTAPPPLTSTSNLKSNKTKKLNLLQYKATKKLERKKKVKCRL